MIKYLLITLLVQDGENQHRHRILHTTENDDIKAAANEYASQFYADDEVEEHDGWWHFFAGSIAVEVENVIELSLYEFQLMSRLFDGYGEMKLYFNIEAAGYNNNLNREEIQIHCGENGNLMIAKTDEGFVVDIYNQNDNVDTMAVWEEQLTPDEEEEKPIFTEEVIKAFKKKWGQSHKDLCEELGYNKKTSDDIIMLDFFWIAEDKKWYNKESSLFTDMEQLIANYLRNNQ